MERIRNVTWLERVRAREKFSALSKTAADAGGEGEIEDFFSFGAETGGFVESGKVGIVSEEDFSGNEGFYRGSEVNVRPG